MKTFGVGILGCGDILKTYARLLPRFRRLKVVGCADRIPERAAVWAERFAIPAWSPAELLARPEVDIVLNLTVPAAHAEVSAAALEAGKHLL